MFKLKTGSSLYPRRNIVIVSMYVYSLVVLYGAYIVWYMFKLINVLLANQLAPSIFIFLDPLIIVSIMGLFLWLNLKMKQKKNWARVSCLVLAIGLGLIVFWCNFVLALNNMRDELLKAFYLLHSIIATQLCLSLIRKDIKPWFSEKKTLLD